MCDKEKQPEEKTQEERLDDLEREAQEIRDRVNKLAEKLITGSGPDKENEDEQNQ